MKVESTVDREGKLVTLLGIDTSSLRGAGR